MSKGVGASLLRFEDDRFLRGRARFVGDLSMPGMVEAAFVRSPLAHARIRRIHKPPFAAAQVFTAEDLAGVKPIRAISDLPTYKASDWPALATDKSRYVGQTIAICYAESRARAEDIADSVEIDFDELPAVVDMLAGRATDAPLLHEDWGSNIAFELSREDDIEAVAQRAPVRVTRELRTSRHAMLPMEGKGVLAYWDHRLNQLVVHSSTQVPHMIRTGIAEALSLEERQVRVIAPDVGGGFGYKCALHPEEIAVSWLAIKLDRPVRWIEDRYEHLSAGANTREHHFVVTGYADERGRLLALDAEVTVDAGAYSWWPGTSTVEAAMSAGALPGPYRIDVYRVRTWTVATNKPPLVPYRGVARTSVCFAIESLMDAIAGAVGREPHEVRLENLVPPSAMPYVNIVGKHYDSGDYPECLRRVVSALDLPAVRARQRRGESDGRLIGVGVATFVEQSAYGTSVFAGWGLRMVPGFEQAGARLTLDGGLELTLGVQSHGQGMETTMAQVAHQVLGIDPARVSVCHGDTGRSPYSIGTINSRSMVMAGGAVSRACEALARRLVDIGAHLLQVQPAACKLREGTVVSGNRSVSIDEICRVWYNRGHELPQNVDRGGLDVTMGYRPEPDGGTFSYATHGVVVAVDPLFGSVELLDYVVIEDCGTMVNPMIVDGQVRGGTAQGIGTALYEEMPFSADGQPGATTLLDYLLPGACEIPNIRVQHMETKSPYTEYGIKGVGESGAIGPPAAIVNAINDALRPIGAELLQLPASPDRILATIARSQTGSRAP